MPIAALLRNLRTRPSARIALYLTLLVTVGPFVLMQPVLFPGKPHEEKAQADQLERDVRMLATTLHPRNYTTPGLDQTATYVEQRFRETSARVELQPYVARGYPVRNVVAKFGPATGPVLVIGAHYDSHFDTPGADDNASGVAGLLELARMLSRNPPRQSVELVAYTLEEPPFFRSEFMGSYVHAAALKRAGRAVTGMVSLEMIGYYDDKPSSQRYLIPGMGLLYPTKADFVGVVGRFSDWQQVRDVKAALMASGDIRVRSINAPVSVQGVDYSDQRSYWGLGYPAVMVTDTSFMRNAMYHEVGDTPDKLDYRRMAFVVEGVHAYIQRKAGREQ